MAFSTIYIYTYAYNYIYNIYNIDILVYNNIYLLFHFSRCQLNHSIHCCLYKG